MVTLPTRIMFPDLSSQSRPFLKWVSPRNTSLTELASALQRCDVCVGGSLWIDVLLACIVSVAILRCVIVGDKFSAVHSRRLASSLLAVGDLSTHWTLVCIAGTWRLESCPVYYGGSGRLRPAHPRVRIREGRLGLGPQRGESGVLRRHRERRKAAGFGAACSKRPRQRAAMLALNWTVARGLPQLAHSAKDEMPRWQRQDAEMARRCGKTSFRVATSQSHGIASLGFTLGRCGACLGQLVECLLALHGA